MTNRPHAPKPYIERILRSNSTDEFAFIKTQDVTEVLRAAKGAQEMIKKDTGPVQGRYIATVPVIVAEQWARECGAAIGTKEWSKYAKKKLKDPEFSGFRVHS